MTRKEKETLSKKANILGCVLELMREHPVSDISIKQIADKAEYSKGNLYGYFKNKDEILVALQYISVRFWCDTQDWAVTHHEHNLIKLGYIGFTRMLFMENYPLMHRCNNLTTEIDYSTLHDSRYMAALKEFSNKSDGTFRDAIINGVKQNQIRDFVDPKTLICLLESFSEGVFNKISQARKTGSHYCDPDKLHEEYMNFIGSVLTTENKLEFNINKESFQDEMLKRFPNDSSAIVNRFII